MRADRSVRSCWVVGSDAQVLRRRTALAPTGFAAATGRTIIYGRGSSAKSADDLSSVTDLTDANFSSPHAIEPSALRMYLVEETG
jgi:hypothetical protein